MLVSLAMRVLGSDAGLGGFACLVVRVVEVGFLFTMASSISIEIVRCNNFLDWGFRAGSRSLKDEYKSFKNR
jgi:hypothetical protein